jgi:hypothetical protein
MVWKVVFTPTTLPRSSECDPPPMVCYVLGRVHCNNFQAVPSPGHPPSLSTRGRGPRGCTAPLSAPPKQRQSSSTSLGMAFEGHFWCCFFSFYLWGIKMHLLSFLSFFLSFFIWWFQYVFYFMQLIQANVELFKKKCVIRCTSNTFFAFMTKKSKI